MIIDIVPWVSGFVWNLAGGYYHYLKTNGMAGVYMDFNNYCNKIQYESNITIAIDPIFISLNFSKELIDSFIYKIKKYNVKLVLFEYESIFNTDYSAKYIYNNDSPDNIALKLSELKNNDYNWTKLISNADLLIVSDPRDEYVINNKLFSCNYYPKTIYLPLCTDTNLFVENKIIINDCCFFGSTSCGDRTGFTTNLKTRNIFAINSCTIHHLTYEQKKQDIINYISHFSKYLININSKGSFAGLQNRIYETMAVNRICLSHKPTNLPGRENIWKNIKNVVWYDSDDQISDICNDIINNKEKYSYILKNARQEVIENYTNEIKIKSILNNL